MDNLISIQEMAQKLGVTEKTVREKCKNKSFPAVKLCRKWFILKKEFEEEISKKMHENLRA